MSPPPDENELDDDGGSTELDDEPDLVDDALLAEPEELVPPTDADDFWAAELFALAELV